MLTRKDVVERLVALRHSEQEAFAQYQALGGAVQDCEWFLEQFPEESEPATSGDQDG